MRVLALDTATPLAGVAVLDGRTGAAALRQQRVSTHSETLLCLVRECLDELGLRPAALEAVVCGSGPGSFTGLRIGAATAKGLCYALGAPLVLVSSLAALAAQAPAGPVLATLDAYRGQIYARLALPQDLDAAAADAAVPPALAALLDQHPALREDAAWDPDALVQLLSPLTAADPLGPLWLVGDGPARYPQLAALGQAPDLAPEGRALSSSPPPLLLARLGLARLARGQVDDVMSATPNYAALSAAEQRREAPPHRGEGA